MRIKLLRDLILMTFMALMFGANARAQSTCAEAVSQLQQYVAGVNQFANNEFYQGIPMKCGGNGACMQWWLQQLNAWHMGQMNMVNGWYQQIVGSCSAGSPDRTVAREKVKTRKTTTASPPEVDEEQIASIDVDDEDKTVRIRIPDTPMGYR